MECKQVQSLLETFVDGELNPQQTLAIEEHLATGCEPCVERFRFASAVKASTQHAVRQDVQIDDSFRQRLTAAIAAEEKREQTGSGSVISLTPSRWRAISGIAAAAALLLVWVGSQQWTGQSGHLPEQAATSSASVMNPSLGIEHALDRLIDHHSSPPQPQVTQPELLPALEPNVGVRVHLPSSLARFGARWEGAALVPVSNHQAASLRYRIPARRVLPRSTEYPMVSSAIGHRVTVYVYDPSKVPVHQSLQRQLVRDEPIYLGKWRGYTVAAKQNRGVGYAVATDIDDDSRIAELVTAIH